SAPNNQVRRTFKVRRTFVRNRVACAMMLASLCKHNWRCFIVRTTIMAEEELLYNIEWIA
ncbi:MAG TPA: hypothetical protein PLK31_27075, partial [Chloroflexota bacterium]|nr:hypothetical protein [Chloroflexota bacterium]